MKKFARIFTVIFLAITSVTVLVMLSLSFEQFNRKYLPSFMLAQKYVLPLIVSAMAVVYLTFFEPERLSDRRIGTVMGVVLGATLTVFSVYLSTLDPGTLTFFTGALFLIQWLALATETVIFFRHKNDKTAR